MVARVEKCPDGFAVIVPTSLANQAGLHAGFPIVLEFAGGYLVVRPKSSPTLDELLARITPENLHGEWADGPPVGSECC